MNSQNEAQNLFTISKSEIFYLIHSYLQKEGLKKTYECFLKESKDIVDNLQVKKSKNIKGLDYILNEYVQIKQREKRRNKYLHLYSKEKPLYHILEKIDSLFNDIYCDSTADPKEPKTNSSDQVEEAKETIVADQMKSTPSNFISDIVEHPDSESKEQDQDQDQEQDQEHQVSLPPLSPPTHTIYSSGSIFHSKLIPHTAISSSLPSQRPDFLVKSPVRRRKHTPKKRSEPTPSLDDNLKALINNSERFANYINEFLADEYPHHSSPPTADDLQLPSNFFHSYQDVNIDNGKLDEIMGSIEHDPELSSAMNRLAETIDHAPPNVLKRRKIEQ